jgi:tetratricopeptide (TPR) repeat protein
MALMQNSPLRTLLISLAVVSALVAGAYWLLTRSSGGFSPAASTTAVTLSDGTVVIVPAGATVTELEDEEPTPTGPQAPDFRKPIVYSASVSVEVRASAEAQRAQNVATLEKNSQDFNAWMNLAVVKKIAGDYRGAEEIWLYAIKAWPESSIAFGNLADLYQNFLKDPAKAKLYSDQAAKLQTQ